MHTRSCPRGRTCGKVRTTLAAVNLSTYSRRRLARVGEISVIASLVVELEANLTEGSSLPFQLATANSWLVKSVPTRSPELYLQAGRQMAGRMRAAGAA